MLCATPISLGPVSLKNRFVMSAMGSGLGDPSGAPNERLIRYLEVRAEAEVAMIIVEATGVMATLRYTPRQPSLAFDRVLPAWRELAGRIQRQGAKLAVQLQHPGRQTLDQSEGGTVAPSPIGTRHGGPTPRALSVAEIEEIVASFGAAAARARSAGLDAVELHAGHGYLFTQFLSPAANHRDDGYGGPLENRFRFLEEVVRAIQSAAGHDYPIIVRLSVDEFVDGGATLDESLRVAHWLKELGIVALRVSGGSNDQRIPVMIPPTDAPRGIFWEHSKIVRTEVGLPVDAAARIQTAELAERLLREGFADFISLGRPLLADPAFVRKALENAPTTPTRPCIACNQGCIDRILDRRIGMITCLVNPEVGREHEALLDRPRPSSRKVMIAGAGPAGIEAALVARLRGHDVRLFEASPTLGGEFAYAHRPPGKEDFATFLPFCEQELRRLDVDVQLNTSVDEMLIAEHDPDVLIWAAGAQRRPPFAESPVRQCSVTDIYGDGIPAGRSAVVVGTSWEGAETALALAAAGIEVTCLEPESKFGRRLSPVTRRWLVRQRADEAGIRIACGVRDLSLASGRVRWSADDAEHSTVCDFIVYEGTRVQRPAPATPAGLRLVTIGDAAQPASAFEAIRSAFDIVLTIQ